MSFGGVQVTRAFISIFTKRIRLREFQSDHGLNTFQACGWFVRSGLRGQMAQPSTRCAMGVDGRRSTRLPSEPMRKSTSPSGSGRDAKYLQNRVAHLSNRILCQKQDTCLLAAVDLGTPPAGKRTSATGGLGSCSNCTSNITLHTQK